jgi:eukaryotic-like serine/threonine-protein kinase
VVETRNEQSEEPEGTVTAQDPEGDTEADEGSTVTLTVSAGPETVPVPNVVGQPEADARNALTAAGFLVQTEPREDTDAEQGTVVDQNPPADSPAAPGATVTLGVAAGPGSVSVPDVAGQDAGTAANTLQEAGLSPQRADEASDSVPEGQVIRTEPGAGSQVEEGTQVTFFVSTGAGQVGVPNVVGLNEDNARRQLESAGFQVNVTENDTFDPREDGEVVSQSPTSGQQADAGSTVNIVVNRFREPEVTITTSTTDGGGNGGGGGD